MIGLYLAALGFGGTLLGATLVFGGDHHGGAGHQGHELGDVLGWLPLTSLRFWTFFLGFGGGIGALLTYAAIGSPALIAALAAGSGWAIGVGAVATIRMLRAGSVSSQLGVGDLPGATGVVTVAIDPGDVGKVRFLAKGQQVDVLAVSDDPAPLPLGTAVVVVEQRGEHLVVAREPDATDAT
ncbi:MAG: hypothetical protein K8W52_42840 [Deltaproteobacteria bacterium]|nr:hypothetical protein [Deltaproteobacteria bacterium]